VGGNIEQRESIIGYQALHEPCPPRTARTIASELEAQFELVFQTGNKKKVEELHTSTIVKDSVADMWHDRLVYRRSELTANDTALTKEQVSVALRQWFDVQPGDKLNPLLSVPGLDPPRDTAVEILHTFLLGAVNRLASNDTNGLASAGVLAKYIWQYKDGLIGKHFKLLAQTMTFHTHDLVPPPLFSMIKTVGALGAALWYPEITDMAQYQRDLAVLIGNMLDAFDDVNPSYILVKVKLHCLTHLVEDVKRFGPAIRKSTEVFEKYNSVFRQSIILSNRQTDSRDAADRFGLMDVTTNAASGGWFADQHVEGGWRQAGKIVSLLPVSRILLYSLFLVLNISPRQIYLLLYITTPFTFHPITLSAPTSSLSPTTPSLPAIPVANARLTSFADPITGRAYRTISVAMSHHSIPVRKPSLPNVFPMDS
ncbi:MAG: hypothetical protein TREMPRED_000913, partial [Tremellales sp. Tagirdzhanova-0007]